jgi:hypothetical protein
MIGNWLKRKVQIASVRAAREDLDRFNASLRGATDREIGMVMAIATIIRLRLTTSGRLPRNAFALPTPGDGSAQLQLYLSGMVREFQKIGQPSDAAGAMVWLHSMRALGFPEVRELGRDMWKELQRGFPYVSDALSDIEALTGNQLAAGADTACTFVPEDLAPFA